MSDVHLPYGAQGRRLMRDIGGNKKVAFEARASASGYVVLGLIFSFPSLVSVIVIAHRPETFLNLVPLLLIGIGATTCCYIWLAFFRISISGGVLTYRTFFGGVKRIEVDRIAEANLRTEYRPWGCF